jgi:hypothetical protein
MMGMTLSLFQHWADALRSSSALLAKVYRFLMRFYGGQADRIAFPPVSVPTGFIHLDPEVRPKPLKTPHQIRSLLMKIAEAVGKSAPPDPW